MEESIRCHSDLLVDIKKPANHNYLLLLLIHSAFWFLFIKFDSIYNEWTYFKLKVVYFRFKIRSWANYILHNIMSSEDRKRYIDRFTVGAIFWIEMVPVATGLYLTSIALKNNVRVNRNHDTEDRDGLILLHTKCVKYSCKWNNISRSIVSFSISWWILKNIMAHIVSYKIIRYHSYIHNSL